MMNMNEMMSKMMEQMAEQMMQNMMQMMMQNMMQSMTGTVSDQSQTTEKVEADVEAEAPKTSKGHSIYHYADVKCKWTIEKIADKQYAIKDGIFTFSRWIPSKTKANEEIRGRLNLEAHKLALQKIKALDNVKAFDHPDGYKCYGFATKKAAEEAITHLPEAIQKMEIEEYIAKNGKIKFDWAVRKADTKERIK